MRSSVKYGTEPGTVDAAMNPMMPIIARRPLLISAIRLRSFCSSVLPDRYFEPKYQTRSCVPDLPPRM